MFVKVLSFVFVLSIFSHCGECAMRKSWKSAANFDEEVPKFTPFESVEAVDQQKVEVPPVPAPTVETLKAKISSKIKAPTKHVTDILKKLKQEQERNDFGTFVEKAPETTTEATHEELDIDSILNQLADDGDVGKDTVNNSLEKESEDEIDIATISSTSNTTNYKVGPFMNVTVDNEESMVNVNLDQNALKEIFTGRGKKYNLLERVVPLFILPFLIQSAVIPFMVTTIKLFLMKSLFAGKIAVLLLMLGALKNHQNSIYMKSLHQPYYLKDFPQYPERRIETNSFEGYKAEGKPSAFIN